MRASGLWEAGEGKGRHGDAERGGGSVHMTLSVAHADKPIAVVTLATTSHEAAQAGHGAPSCLLTSSSRFCHSHGVFVLPQLQAAPERDGLLPAGPCPHLQQWGRDRRWALPWGGGTDRGANGTRRRGQVRRDQRGGGLCRWGHRSPRLWAWGLFSGGGDAAVG